MWRSFVRRMTLAQKLVLLISFLTFGTVLLFTLSGVMNQKKSTLQGIDDKLHTCAYGARLLIEPFQLTLMEGKKADQEECNRINDLLSSYCKEIGVRYIYAMVEQADTIKFTASSYTDEEKKNNDTTALYEVYEDPSKELVASFKDGKIHYDSYQDKWGRFRSVFIPIDLPNGGRYVIGADFQLTEINKMLWHNIMQSVVLGAFLFILAVTGGFLLVKPITRHIATIAERVKRI
ncbi:MAG TPA: hypothetical protein VFR01_04595, partial [Geobacterales bacterium]|nr:hypothetical protein [Geobacterales bacterium]